MTEVATPSSPLVHVRLLHFPLRLHMRTQELNRAQQATLKDVSKSIKHLVTALDREVAKIEKQVAKLIDGDDSTFQRKAIASSRMAVAPAAQ